MKKKKKHIETRSIREQLSEFSGDWDGDYGVTVNLGLFEELENDPDELTSVLEQTRNEVSGALDWLESLERILYPAVEAARDAEYELIEAATAQTGGHPTEEQLVAARKTAFVAALDKSSALVGAE